MFSCFIRFLRCAATSVRFENIIFHVVTLSMSDILPEPFDWDYMLSRNATASAIVIGLVMLSTSERPLAR